MLRLMVVVASTRPGRVGLPVGQWFFEHARQSGKFDVEWADLKELNLPPMDEPKHPRLRQYEHEHTKAWSAKVSAADAFVFVTPEYNYNPAPALLNAIDYLFVEWHHKVAGFVSYGGISGGMRAVEATKPILTAVKIMPLPEAVALPMVFQQLKEGRLEVTDAQRKAADAMLEELARWAEALKRLRG